MRLVPVVVAALALVGCSTVDPARADPQPVYGRTFASVAVDGEQIPGGGPLTVTFDGDRISTFAGCNHGSGSVDLSNGRLKTGQLATTMMACPAPVGDADRWMAQFFDASPSWSLVGDTLTLHTDTATVTLHDEKVVNPDRSLTGTMWVVQSLVSYQAVSTSTALEHARPNLLIGADGTVTGWTGCNHISSHADLAEAPDAITLGPITAQGKVCPEGAGEIQEAVLYVLSGRVSTTINGDELRIADGKSGRGLILRAQ